ncbi:hypothetical protein Q1695_004310 [Nippostrongylus brasiliensis]|nr:hypothetical protein Q1695_004310 [Nippostrongylus brasiliensis]
MLSLTCLQAVVFIVLASNADAEAASNTTALTVVSSPSTTSVSAITPLIRAKRQWGGFGCCPIMPPMCCPMPLLLPPPIPPPILMPSCCGCCLPVCMPTCINMGCGCGGGLFGRRKRSAILQRNPVALRLNWKH